MKDTLDDHAADLTYCNLAGYRTLADVSAQCDAELDGLALRDKRSAFRFLERKAGVDLAKTPASGPAMRELFAGLSSPRLGVSEKRIANVRSCILAAVKRHGMARGWMGRSIDLSPEWSELLSRITYVQARWAVRRLAEYCSLNAIPPKHVTSETLIGFQSAHEAVELHKDPAKLRKRVIAMWNRCQRDVPGWPRIRLASPFASDPFMYALEAFPPGFRSDVASWLDRGSNSNPLDPDAPVRALRPDTLKGHVFALRRMASSLVHQGIVPLGKVTGFHVLLLPGRPRAVLELHKENSPGYLAKMLALLRSIAISRRDVAPEMLEEIECYLRRLTAKGGRRMSERNRIRLRPFDDPELVTRLVRFPGEHLARSLALHGARRRAKGVEQALAISILVCCAPRIKNLRSLSLDRNIRRAGGKVFLSWSEEETKTHDRHDVELPESCIRILDLFLAEHRSLLPGADSRWLFPGEAGEARSYSAMRDAVTRPLEQYAGITLSPHLYRHVLAKIVIERHPEMLHDVSRVLGHSRVNTTFSSYLGTEGPAASRRISAALSDLVEAPAPAVARNRKKTGVRT